MTNLRLPAARKVESFRRNRIKVMELIRKCNSPVEKDFLEVVHEDRVTLVGEVAHVLPPGDWGTWDGSVKW